MIKAVFAPILFPFSAKYAMLAPIPIPITNQSASILANVIRTQKGMQDAPAFV